MMMQKKKYIAILMVVLLAVLLAPMSVSVWADQEEPVFENLPVMVDPGEIMPTSLENDEEGVQPLAVEYEGSLVKLDVSSGAVVITPDGATLGGVAVGTELNAAGYYIYSSADLAVTGSVTLACTASSQFAAPLTIELADGLNITSETAPINIGSYADVKLVLNNNALKATGGSKYHGTYAGIRITKDSTVDLQIKGTNTVFSAKSTAILVCDGATLAIDGAADAKLTATAERTGGSCAAIGTVYAANSSNIDSGDDNLYKKIEFNGGQVVAVNGNGKKTNIGNPANSTIADGVGNIVINGGYVEALTSKSGYYTIASSTGDSDKAVVINGGSVNAVLKTDPRPLDNDGQTLYLVKGAVPEGTADGSEFAIALQNGKEAVAVGGYLYLYLPLDDMDSMQLAATCGGSNYAGEITGDKTNGFVATLALDENTCICTPTTAGLEFADADVTVYSFIGYAEVTLKAKFVPDEDCAKSHTANVTYELVGADSSKAELNANVLKVYPAADGEALTVKATATVNGTTYTKNADFAVALSDDYVLDVAKGTITIEDDEITVGDEVYNNRDTSVPIKIVQSGRGAVSNHILVNSAAQITLSNINLKKEYVTSSVGQMHREDALLDINDNVVLILSGDNKIDSDVGSTYLGVYDKPAIYVNGPDTLTIKADEDGGGTLWLHSGGKSAAMGGKSAKHGKITIESGRITAVGGAGIADTPAPGIGTAGGVTGNENTLKVTGGLLIAVGGDGATRDIKADVVIDGGSLATLADDGTTGADISFYTDGSRPKNSAGQKLYRVVLTAEGNEANLPAHVVVDLQHNAADGTTWQKDQEFDTYTDAAGKLYMYLPADGKYHAIMAKIGEKTYYKRIKLAEDDTNAAVMVAEPKVEVDSFLLAGQMGETQIDNELHTITLEVQSGVDIASVVPSMTANGAEFFPSDGSAADSKQDFSGGKTVCYTVINDKGEAVEYAVKVTQVALGADEKTTLNIANGSISMRDDGTGNPQITVGGVSISYNPNGYIITGTNSNASINLLGITTEIVFKDLDLTYTGSGTAIYCYTEQGSAKITLDGVNKISAPNGAIPLYISAKAQNVNYTIGGEGILKLDATSQAIYALNTTGLVINDGASVFVPDGLTSAQVTDASGNKLYPLLITVDDTKAKNSKVAYQDRLITATAMNTAINYLADENGKIVVYRQPGSYNIAVQATGSSDVCYGNATLVDRQVAVTVGTPKVTQLVNLMSESALGNKEWRIKVLGNTYLGGEIVVKATGEDGEEITATAVQVDKSVWEAKLNIPNNSKGREYTYTLSATVDGKAQTGVKADTIKMLSKLTIDKCSIVNAKYQIGEAEFGEDDTGQKFIKMTVPYDLDLDDDATVVKLAMEPVVGAYYSPANGSSLNFKKNSTYDNTHSILQWISNSAIFTDGDRTSYLITLTNEPTPEVTDLEVNGKIGYSGEYIKLNLTLTNGASLRNAYHTDVNGAVRGDQIVIKVQDKTYTVDAKDVKANACTVQVQLPPNRTSTTDPNAGMTSIDCPIEVYINGVEQLTATPVVVSVPGEMEMNATIKNVSFGDKLPEYTADENQEIKDKYNYGFDDPNIRDNAENVTGTITVRVPWLTDLNTLANPSVTTRNPNATYAFGSKTVAADGISYTQTITVTPVKGSTKDYTLTVTRVATKAEQNAEVQSFAYPASSVVSSDPDLAAADNAEITAKYGYGYNVAQIDHTKGEIKILLPWGTALADVTPQVGLAHNLATYTLTDVGTGDDVTKTQKLKVTAVDGTTKEYTVIITRVATKAEQDATIHNVTVEELLDVSFGEKQNEDGLWPITVTVNRGLELNGLTPTLELGHKCTTYTPAGPQDFTDGPVEYTVTAVDGTQLKYALEIVHKRKSKNNNVKLETTEETREMTAYVTGKEDGNFHPEDVMSRAEAATMLARVHDKFDKTADYATDYVDVPADAWFADYVGFLSKQGVVQGNDKGEFMPTADVSRMEFAAMLARFADLAIDADVVSTFSDTAGTWGEAEIMALVNEGVVAGYNDGTFRPHNNLTRAEAVTMVNRLMKRGTTKQELAALSQVANPFGDIDESHWAYSDVISAVTDYSLYVKTETLGKIHDEWVTVTLTGQAE